MKKITSMEELKEVLEIEGEVIEGYILLNGGIRSSCNNHKYTDTTVVYKSIYETIKTILKDK